MTQLPHELILPCGCRPSSGKYCKTHKTQMYFEAWMLERWMASGRVADYRQYRRARDVRLSHHRSQGK